MKRVCHQRVEETVTQTGKAMWAELDRYVTLRHGTLSTWFP